MIVEFDNRLENLTAYVPVPNPDVECLPLEDGGAHLHLTRYIRLTAPQWHLWQMIDGHTTVAELSNRMGAEKSSGREAVARFIYNLAALGFIANYPASIGAQKPPARKGRSISDWWRLISKILRPRLSFPLPMWITRWLYGNLFRYFFHKIMLLPVLMVIAAAAWRYLSTQSIQDFRFLQIFEGSLPIGNLLIPKLLITYIMIFVIASIHELGHAMAAMHFGRPIREAGIALIALIFLASYVRMKDTWLLPRRRRIFVLLSGGLSSGLLGALLIWSGFLSGDTPLGMYLRDLGMFSLSATLLNFYPFLFRTDGYFILEDLLGLPRLREKAWKALIFRNRAHKDPVPVTGWLKASMFVYAFAQFLSYSGLFYWLFNFA